MNSLNQRYDQYIFATKNKIKICHIFTNNNVNIKSQFMIRLASPSSPYFCVVASVLNFSAWRDKSTLQIVSL